MVLNALDAAERGAEILTRTRCRRLRRVDGLWEAELAAEDCGPVRTLRARALVNTAGPWVTEVLGQIAGANRQSGLRLIKGSHIVVPRLYPGDQAYLLQNPDRRIVFVIPYEQDFSLIGTTDIPYQGDPAEVRISTDEITYLCTAVNGYLTKPVKPEDVVWSYSGVRPLYDEPLVLDEGEGVRVRDVDGQEYLDLPGHAWGFVG